MKQSIAHACVGLALAACLVTLVAALAAAQQTAQQAAQLAAQQPTGPSDPLEYFAEMMPVFSHDRCTGCHGRVNPELATGNNHSMGQFTNPADCNDCHSQAPNWRTRPDLTFFNKNTKQLCQMQSAEVDLTRDHARANSMPIALADAAYLGHLSGDSLVGTAFTGTAAGAFGRANPPPMKRTDFVAAADAWLKVGAGCGGWEGYIKQTEKFGSNYEYGTTQVNETAERVLRIDRAGGVNTGTLTMSGHSTLIQTTHLDGLNGPCTNVTTSNSSWIGLPLDEPGFTVRVQIVDDRNYTIRFSVPMVRTRTNSTGHNVNDCGINLPPSAQDPPEELDLVPWAFTIRCPSEHGICQIFDPDNPRLSGTIDRTIMDHKEAADPQSWLAVSPVGISRADDGTSLPVKVTTTWDLTLED